MFGTSETTRSRTCRWAAVPAALLLIATGAQMVGAQLVPGDHLRIRQRAGSSEVTTTGRFVSLTSNYLSVTPREEQISIARDSILSVERAVPGPGHGPQGAVLGAMGGLLAGWLIGRAAANTVPDGDFSNLVKAEGTYVLTGAGGIVGALVGAIVGSNIRDDVWQPVQVGVQPQWRNDGRTFRIAVVARF